MESRNPNPRNESGSGDDSLNQRLEALAVSEGSDDNSAAPAGSPGLSYAAVAGRANSDIAEGAKMPKDGGEGKQTPDVAKTSTLSAEAAEFVPRWLQSSEPGSKSALPSTGTGFGKLDTPAAAEYRSIAEKIVKSPNQADELIPSLVDKLRVEKTADARSDALRGICGIIVEKAATDYGARHAMGRMINVVLQTFSSSKSGDISAEFWTALEAQFKREHENATETLAKNPSRYKTFAFFLAEVLGTSSRMFGHQKANELSDLVLIVLEDFFRTEDGEQWKIAGQVLKQVGAYLEDNFARRKDSTGLSEMDRFMLGVETRGHSGREDIPFYIRSMLINILELRAYNWGRNCVPSGGGAAEPQPVHQPQPSHPPPPPPSYNNAAPSNEVICHDGSGMSLNSEERQFLENEGCFDECPEEFDNGMDEEMEKDYELFLQMNSNGQ